MGNKEQKTVRTETKEILHINGIQYIVVRIPRTNKTYKVRQLTPTQMDDLANLFFGKYKDLSEAIVLDKKIAFKAAAIYTTPNYWKRKLSFWLKWRWLYYIKQYDDIQIQSILSAGNESTPYLDFLKNISLLCNARDTLSQMTMRKAEKTIKEFSKIAEKGEEESVDKK